MLRLSNITKAFGRHTALDTIDLKVARGEIHGLAGANGSGKSSLLNILFGTPVIGETGGYSGEIFLQDKPCHITSPRSAIAAGFGMIHQELAIIPEMTVAENINLTREPVHARSEKLLGYDFALIDRLQSTEKARLALKSLGIALDLQHKVGNLPLNGKQFVEMARELTRNDLKVLLLDEPTAVLNSEETTFFLETIRSLAETGVAIIYVSHRLDELFCLCDSLTVLKNGRVSGRFFSRQEFDRQTVTECMIDGVVTLSRKTTRPEPKAAVHVKIRDLSVDMPGEALNGLDLDIKKGEILGLVSLSGHGKMALGPGLMGQFAVSGKLAIKDREVNDFSPASMLACGFFMVPEDRSQAGLLLDHSVAENIVFSALHFSNRFLRDFSLLPFSFPSHKRIKDYSLECLQTYEIACTDISQKVGELSGGNQQKICIARALAAEPEILFINEPTRGIDLNTKERILDLFIAINERMDTTLIIASSELAELKRICDRIAVLYQGRLSAILPPEADDLTFFEAMSGNVTIQ